MAKTSRERELQRRIAILENRLHKTTQELAEEQGRQKSADERLQDMAYPEHTPPHQEPMTPEQISEAVNFRHRLAHAKSGVRSPGVGKNQPTDPFSVAIHTFFYFWDGGKPR